MRKVSAGTGYDYLTKSVATNDAEDPDRGHGKAPNLHSYYHARGTPPGRWHGSGLTGLHTDTLAEGELVTEDHMQALFGEGLHPNTDQMMDRGATIKDCQLGRMYPTYTGGSAVLEALREHEKHLQRTRGRRLTTQERSALVQIIARPMLEEQWEMEGKDTAGLTASDVIRWVNKEKAKVKQPVAGFDLTFSPVKSVSVMWALSDKETAQLIAQCHHQAVRDTLAWAEKNVIRTRQGAGGIHQVATKGVIACEFTHFDTRAGDPDLHSHVVIANKVQAPDGSWKAVDARPLHHYGQALSARYDVTLQSLLTHKLGVDFTPQERHADREPVWEITGIPHELTHEFSKRRRTARPVYQQLVRDYTARHHKAPSRVVAKKLWQHAILTTREKKGPAQSLASLRQKWRDEVLAMDNGQKLLDTVQHTATTPDDDTRIRYETTHNDDIITAALARVTEKRSHFKRHHLDTAISVELKKYALPDSITTADLTDHLVDAALKKDDTHSLNDEPLTMPRALTTDSGHALDHTIDTDTYTTTPVLNAEHNALTACTTPVAVFARTRTLTRALAAHTKKNGWSLNPEQEALTRHLLTCGTLAACGVGPAGTGKTASMQVVADTWTREGHKVIGLAPSAAAARVLQNEIGVQALTIDKLTYTWCGKNPARRGHDLSELAVTINPGDMLLVDEAGMATTENIAAICDIARASGAIVRFIGDPKQLDAVDTGGLFGAMTRQTPTQELSTVRRFGADREQADASLKLRDGKTDGLDLYHHRGLIHGGDRATMIAHATAGYLNDIDHGRQSLIIAPTNDDCDRINQLVRQHRIDQRKVATRGRRITLAHGEEATRGDIIITRQNRRFYKDTDGCDGSVINGDLWTITRITRRGDIIARHQHTGHTQTLPADYVAENVHLGYASTVHRAQGATVTTTHAVVDTTMDRAGLYVALTRGKSTNSSYVVTEPFLDEDEEDAHSHMRGDTPAPTAREVMERILHRDTHQRAAIEEVLRLREDATSPERLERLWRAGHDLAVDTFINHELESWLDHLPAQHTYTIRHCEDKDRPIRTAWRELIGAGIDPRTHMSAACEGLDDAHDPVRLITYRLRNHLPTHPGRDGLPPLTPESDTELLTWLIEHAPTPESTHTGGTAQHTRRNDHKATSQKTRRIKPARTRATTPSIPQPAMPNEALASLLGAPDASDAVKEAHRRPRPDDSATTTQPYTEEHTDALEL